jgi:hypothetical protein
MKQPLGAIDCLWGTAYLDIDGVWKCPSGNEQVHYPLQPPNTRPLTNTVYVPVSTPPITAVGNAVPENTILTWIKSHPYLTATALLAILYFVFFKDKLGASSKVRTDITRWGL